MPGMPGTLHVVEDAPTVHGPEPDTAPDSVIVNAGTGPPTLDVTWSTTAIGNGQGVCTQSGPMMLQPVLTQARSARVTTSRLLVLMGRIRYQPESSGYTLRCFTASRGPANMSATVSRQVM